MTDSFLSEGGISSEGGLLPEDLNVNVAETRAVLARLSASVHGNSERVSPVLLNRALLQLLKNDETILSTLAQLLARRPAPLPEKEERREAPAPSPSISVKTRRAAPRNEEDELASLGLQVVEHLEAEEHGARNGSKGAAAPSAPAPSAPPSSPAPSSPSPAPSSPPPGEPAMASPKQVTETVTGSLAREVVSEFDVRDKAFGRGLEKLNSWLTSGSGGLPFQKRDEIAYLNTGASSDAMISRIESELMGREGFAFRLGKLVLDGLEGDVVIYAKRRRI